MYASNRSNFNIKIRQIAHIQKCILNYVYIPSIQNLPKRTFWFLLIANSPNLVLTKINVPAIILWYIIIHVYIYLH